MFKIFTDFADWIVITLLGLDPVKSHYAGSLHFFIEDITKIFVMLFVLIYLIALARASLNVQWVREHLAGKNSYYGYFTASIFGAVTPFCSCSSIPLFLGFTQARIPIGTTMSFLITSPMINEVAIALLGGMLGWRFTLAYCIVGISAGVIGGMFFDFIGADKHLTSLGEAARENQHDVDKVETGKLSWRERHEFASNELFTIVKRIYLWIIVGIAVGALAHGFIPAEWIEEHLGSGKWWSVPLASLIGIPLYANASGIIPVAQALLEKGLPIGTTLAFMMSVVGASFPEFMMLKQVMKVRLLLIFFVLLLVLFTLTGWLFNSDFIGSLINIKIGE